MGTGKERHLRKRKRGKVRICKRACLQTASMWLEFWVSRGRKMRLEGLVGADMKGPCMVY